MNPCSSVTTSPWRYKMRTLSAGREEQPNSQQSQNQQFFRSWGILQMRNIRSTWQVIYTVDWPHKGNSYELLDIQNACLHRGLAEMAGPTLYTLCTALIDVDERTVSILQCNPKKGDVSYVLPICWTKSSKATAADVESSIYMVLRSPYTIFLKQSLDCV